MKIRVTGKPEKQRGNLLEVSCIVTTKVSEHTYAKVETIFKDLCERQI